MADRILAVEEPESSELITGLFKAEGITVRTGVKIERVDHVDGSFVVRVDGADVQADQLLVAAGRSNNIRDIGLETVGLDPAARSVETDERMRAGERLWAVGDITGHGRLHPRLDVPGRGRRRRTSSVRTGRSRRTTGRSAG